MIEQFSTDELNVFDSHIHFFSHRFFSLLAAQSPDLRTAGDPVKEVGEATGFDMPPGDPEAFADLWTEELDRNGVYGALLIASLPGDEVSVAKAVARHPRRFAGAFFFDPTENDAQKRAERCFDELNLSVICLFPAMHHYSVAEEEGVRSIAELVSRRKGKALFVHCGALSVGIRGKLGLKSSFDLRRSSPLDVQKLAAEFPSVNFIIPHFGAGFWREALMACDLCPNIFLDTSSSNKWVKYLSPEVGISDVFRRTLDVVGHERLLFGTDSSVFPRGWNSAVFTEQSTVLAKIGVGAEPARAVFGENLRRILDR